MAADEVLYNRFLSGDSAAYDELMLLHGDQLTAYLCALIHDPHDAEDLMIEAFARIMVKKPRIGDGAFKAYLYKTARNLAIRFADRRRVRVFSFDEIGEELPDAFRTDAEVEKEQVKSTLHSCLDRIEPELREALWLVYFEELSYAEAAAVMKVGAKRIDNLLQRGKRRLRQELEREGITDAKL